MDFFKCDRCGKTFDEFEMNFKKAQEDKLCWCEKCRNTLTTNIKDCYEKYRHLDHLLSDEEWLFAGGDKQRASMILEFWNAIKCSVKNRQDALNSCRNTLTKADRERIEFDSDYE